MPENNGAHLFPEERRRRITSYVAEKKMATVEELCEKFGVSPATVRNDLNQLHEERQISRTHGGAVAFSGVGFELTAADKSTLNTDVKQLIALEAVKHIHEGDSIALDGGTTTFELTKLLSRFHNLRVVTYDLTIASWLDLNTDNSVFVIGGEVRKGYHYMMGSIYRDFLPRLNVDIFIMGANGVDPERGITTPQVETAITKEEIRRGSNHTILLADSSKLGKVAFAKFADMEDVGRLITDDMYGRDIVRAIREAGVQVTVVKTGGAEPEA